MKKTTVFVVIAMIMAILMTGIAFAAAEQASQHSSACEHASEKGKSHANENSVLSSCGLPPPPPGG